MHTPAISVIVPAFNHEAYVVEALESVLAQSLGDLELIVIDDASRDGTWDAIHSVRDPRIRALRHAANQGAHQTLNEGLALAQGRYLAILNSDDRYHPERLARLVEALGDAPRLAFSDVGFMDGKGLPAPDHERARDYAEACRRAGQLAPAGWLLSSNLAISTSNFLFPRSLFDRIGSFANLRYTHDWDWALRASAQLPPVWLRETLLEYRVHPANTLAEDDVWRHVHENAYIQALALGGSLEGLDARAACTALLHNSSLHPAATLAFLVAARRLPRQDELQAFTQPTGGQWFLPGMARDCGLDPRIFLSARTLSNQQQALAAQAALIEERWDTIQRMSESIAQRDASIAAQARLVDERAATMDHMGKEIAHRDEAIAAQARLLEERYAAMEEMSQRILQQQGIIATQQFHIDKLQAHPWNRFRRLVARLRPTRRIPPE
ncbi:glycosyltransferase [Zoogloea sp.]|uniref:glycosyltransferase family 2 protein n=1 Tax=Zoogloea sp. TaxID=49181 RepID=UPI0031FE40C4